MNEKVPVPIEAVLAAISKVMHENIGSTFDLEISERERDSYNGEKIHHIEIHLTIESPLPKKQPAFSA